jgi:hypothetical protein
VVAVVFDFAGGQLEVSIGLLLAFLGLTAFLVVVPFYFNLAVNGRDFIDEHWGDGSIDDDDWGLSIADAKRRVNARLAELADRAEANRAA